MFKLIPAYSFTVTTPNLQTVATVKSQFGIVAWVKFLAASANYSVFWN